MEWYCAHGWALCVPLFVLVVCVFVCVHRKRVTQNQSLLKKSCHGWMDGSTFFVSFSAKKQKGNCSVGSSSKPHDHYTTATTCTRQALGLFFSKEQHTIRKTTSYTIHPLNSLAWKECSRDTRIKPLVTSALV